MLKFFRHKNVTKFVLWALLILILPAFVIWGAGSMGGAKSKGPKCVGTIDGKKISFEDLAKSIGYMRAQLLLNYFDQPKTLGAILNNKPFVAKIAWDRLIMISEANKLKIKGTDKEVVQAVQSNPIFIRGDRFDPGFYEYILANNLGMSPRAFEEMVRDSIKIRKLNEVISRDASITDDEALAEYRDDNKKFILNYVIFDTRDFLDPSKIDEKAIKDYYDKNKANFYSKAALKNDKIQNRQASFDESKDEIRSILAEREALGKAYDQAKATHKMLNQYITDGKLSFKDACSNLVIKASKTPAFSKSDKIDAFDETSLISSIAKALKQSELSEIIQIKKGFIIINVESCVRSDDSGFDKVKEDYSKAALEKKKNKMMEDWLIGAEKKTTLNIDFKDIDKHYQQ